MPGSISIVAPTRNRAYTLRQVVDSWCTQAGVEELVIVDDAGTDDTICIARECRERYPRLGVLHLRNEARYGAARSRLKGVTAATGEYILFCDDDQFLGPDYAQTCRRKLEESGASLVSGRKLYRLPGEPPAAAIHRFGNGHPRQKPFEALRFRINTEALFEGDLEIPFTHDAYLTRRALLLEYGLDPFYCRGNGFREETDVQMRAFLDGHRIVVTNEAHAVHFHLSEVKSGGQRVNRLARYYWTVYYTAYFFRKYFDRARVRLSLPYSRRWAIALFAAAEFYVFFCRPLAVLPARVWQRWRR